jgi:hypothetical protein
VKGRCAGPPRPRRVWARAAVHRDGYQPGKRSSRLSPRPQAVYNCAAIHPKQKGAQRRPGQTTSDPGSRSARLHPTWTVPGSLFSPLQNSEGVRSSSPIAINCRKTPLAKPSAAGFSANSFRDSRPSSFRRFSTSPYSLGSCGRRSLRESTTTFWTENWKSDSCSGWNILACQRGHSIGRRFVKLNGSGHRSGHKLCIVDRDAAPMRKLNA